MVYNSPNVMNRNLPNLHRWKDKSKRTAVLSVCVLLLISACNFPLTDFSVILHPYPTLDPAIFDARPTAPSSAEGAQPPSAPTPLPPPGVDESLYHLYAVRSGDTLKAVSRHFNVAPHEISSLEPIAQAGLLPPGQYLVIPRSAENSGQRETILPDSAVIDSPCADDFDINSFIDSSGGYLSRFSQVVLKERISGAEVVKRVAMNQSVNPRLLLAFIEYRSGLVNGDGPPADIYHPLRLGNDGFRGLYQELSLAARFINMGYYGWRYGELTHLTYTDQVSLRVAPNLNAGSVGVMRLFAELSPSISWEERVIGAGGFMNTYLSMFPDPFICAAEVEPLLTDRITAPILELPFAPGETWSFTAGPHYSWVEGTPLGALDFGPNISAPKCQVSPLWARASAAGSVTRSDNNVVVISLEDEHGDPSGWEVLYLHIARQGSVAVGKHLAVGDPVGHPSCEGGSSTGSHVHLARKYKGEWIGAVGLFDFVLSGWTVIPGERPYLGKLVKDGRQVIARPGGNQDSLISR